MRQPNVWIIGAMTLICLQLCGCEQSPQTNTPNTPPAKLVSVGDGLNRVILTPEAERRVDIQTATVVGNTIPYAAVIYDPQGQAWVYTNPDKLTYLRAKITIAAINGDTVELTSGPPPGTKIVVVGVSELFGTEYLENIEP